MEHYSEDSYLYEDDIADLMDLRQVSQLCLLWLQDILRLTPLRVQDAGHGEWLSGSSVALAVPENHRRGDLPMMGLGLGLGSQIPHFVSAPSEFMIPTARCLFECSSTGPGP